jgi:membrane-bound metal-dependent hydrolase YbcI (DUF457 family)
VHSGGLVAVAAVCASLLGSRLPDADESGARIHRRTRLERRSIVTRLAGRVLRLPMTIFAALAQHRGATHWLLSGAAVTIVLAGAARALWPPLTLPVATGTGCGYCAHLLADACTPHGAHCSAPLAPAAFICFPPRMRLVSGNGGDRVVLTAAAMGLLVLPSA